METEKNLTKQSSGDLNEKKLAAAIGKLTDFFTQIWAVNNTLHLLYSVLEMEDREIANPASSLEICTLQLDYIYRQSADLLDIIIECTGVNKNLI